MRTSHSIKLGQWITSNRVPIETGGKTVQQLAAWASESLGFGVPCSAFTDGCKGLGVKYRKMSQVNCEKLRLQSELGAACKERDLYREALLSCINSGAAQAWLLKKIADDFPNDVDLTNAIEQKLETV